MKYQTQNERLVKMNFDVNMLHNAGIKALNASPEPSTPCPTDAPLEFSAPEPSSTPPQGGYNEAMEFQDLLGCDAPTVPPTPTEPIIPPTIVAPTEAPCASEPPVATPAPTVAPTPTMTPPQNSSQEASGSLMEKIINGAKSFVKNIFG